MRRFGLALLLLTVGAPALSAPNADPPADGTVRGRGKPPLGTLRQGPAATRKPGDGGAGQKRMKPLKRGNQLLARGLYRLAAEAYREAVALEPDSAMAHIGLGTSYARNGNCADALPEFRDWSEARNFGPRVALLAAHCADRQGDPELALEYSLLAWEGKRSSRTALARLAIDAHRFGDRLTVEVATEYLWYVNPEQDESLYVEAVLALRGGDTTEFDIVDALWRREGRSDEEMNRLRARSWLDVGDPVQAYEELRRGGSKLKRGADSRVLMAETSRRLGLIADAERSLANKLMGAIEGADADAVKARMLVDQRRLDEARELLAVYTLEMGEDLVASRWYLARAEGNAAEMERQSAVFAEVRSSPSRTLEQYIPLTDTH